MTKTTKLHLKKIGKYTAIFLNVGILFFWSYYVTGKFIKQGIDLGDQLQFACVIALIIIFGHLIASMVQNPRSMADFWITLCLNFLAAPVLITLLGLNGGMFDLSDCFFVGAPFLALGIVVPWTSYILLQ